MDAVNTLLKPGDSVWCRLQSPEPGGYLVSLPKSGLEGFLPSHEPIEIGRMVPATFVCMDGDRALLTYAFTLGTTARVQFSTASHQENAFAVWADSYPSFNRIRRAVDLILPAMGETSIMLKLAIGDATEFFQSLETGEFTGCIKISCESKLSRSAVIFKNGRAVGSVYTTKLHPEPHPFELGLKKMMQDLATAQADLEMYELPEDIVLSMSSLFLGYIDHPEANVDNVVYAEKMFEHFSKSESTACLSLLDKSGAPFALGFVHMGNYVGSYGIAERTFSSERARLDELLKDQPETKLRVYILPKAMTTDAVRFGYSLESEQFFVEPEDKN